MLFKKSKVFLSCVAAFSLINPAIAQQEDIERIEITGSKIKRLDMESASPVTVIKAADIAISGISNVEELLQELTVSAGPAGNATNAYWTSNGYATAQINLRGLGIKRTLVLLNGRRIVAGGTGANDSADLNMIPVAIIERVEVLTDGASAIYGADAVAGVVNIITKKTHSGGEFSAKAGMSAEGDAKNKDFNLLLGGNFDRGNAILNINYVDNGSVLQSARNDCPLTEEDGKLECFYSGRTIGGRGALADGSEVQFNQDANGDGNSYETYDNGKHGYNWFESLNASSPMKRLNIASMLNYDINDEVKLSAEVIYANRQSSQIVTPRSFKNIDVAADFIYNPTGQDLTLKSRRNIEVDDPEFYQETNTLQSTLALDGVFSNDWSWLVSYSYGRNTGIDGWSYDMNDERVAQTLDSSLCSVETNAAIPCGDYFGVNELSPQVLDYVTYEREGSGGNEMQSFQAQLNGDLVEFTSGQLSFAAGLEHRKEKGWRNPDAIAHLNGEEDPIAGSYDVNEAFVEFAIPLLSDKAWAKSLHAEVALRYSDYSTFGSDTTHKLGLTWKISEDFMLRTVKSTAFRTPTITELFGGTNTENLITIDPCHNATGTILSNCLADGVPVGFVQEGSTIKTGVGGNPEVQPETADTFTLGAVWQSPFAEDLSFTLDYFDIEIDQAINSVAGSNMLRLCYTDPEAYQAYCNSFQRDPVNKQVTSLLKRPMNAANEQVSGVDANVNYKGQFDMVSLAVNWNTTHLITHENTAFAGAETEELVGKITADRGSFAEWKSNVNIRAAIENWQFAYSVRYIGKADDENGGGPIGSSVPSVSYHDVQLKWSYSDNLQLSAGIDNLFDKKPPYLTSWNDANTDVFTYDTVGQRGYVTLAYQF